MAPLSVIGLAALLEDGLVEMVVREGDVAWRLTPKGRSHLTMMQAGVKP